MGALRASRAVRIGLGIAKAFLAEGALVVVNGRDASKAERTLAELDAGARVLYIAGDVKQRESCEAIIDGTVAHFGRIDILVANVGGASGHAPIVDLTDEAMQDSLVWNFWHTFWTMRRAFHYVIPQPGISIYVAAKHAINGLTKSAAHEVGTMGITVNALCPGAADHHVQLGVRDQAAQQGRRSCRRCSADGLGCGQEHDRLHVPRRRRDDAVLRSRHV